MSGKIKPKLKKAEENKLQKKNNLMNVAYKLFTTKGINETYISDITKEAGVAKGTFYLYFKDKYHLREIIILRKSCAVLKEALEEASKHEFELLYDEGIFFINYIIDYFKRDKNLLKLIHKNLTWSIYRKGLYDKYEYEEFSHVYHEFVTKMNENRDLAIDAEKLLFIIIELTGGVCYNSIILEEPAPIDDMKPILFATIKKILS